MDVKGHTHILYRYMLYVQHTTLYYMLSNNININCIPVNHMTDLCTVLTATVRLT